MAENTQERKTFTYGDGKGQNYYVDDFLRAHADYKNSFLNFARDRGLFDSAALQELSNALDARVAHIKEGKHFNADGTFDEDTSHNVSYTIDKPRKHGLTRKDKNVTQDMRKWVDHYMHKVMGKLTPETQDKGTWDSSKHGFSAYLTGQGLNAKEIFENYDLRDENNPDNARAYTQRLDLLKQHLPQYLSWIQQKGFDFTKNDNEWDDSFLSDLNDLVSNFDTYAKDPKSITAKLRKIGADDAYTTAFTSDKWDLNGSDDDDDPKRRKQVKEFNDAVANHWAQYSALNPQSSTMTAYLGQSNSNFYRTPEEILEWSRNAKGIDMDEYSRRYAENMFDAEAAQYILPILQTNGRIKETTIDGVKYVYDPNSINRENHSFIAIDPITGRMERRFLYDIEEENRQLRNKYLQAQGAAKYQIDLDNYKEGGIISMQTGGPFDVMQYLQSLDDADYEKRAAEKGITARELKESERTPAGDKTLIDNSGFTGNDWVQLATMATNLGSIFLDPISGGLVGAGASTVDFVNDINRDGFQGRDAWNYVKNLGMDAIGMLPVIGDTFGTMGKVKKGLVHFAPKIIGYLGMAQGIANSPQIIDSFTKILDDRDMTTADWQNIANGLNLLVSGSRVAKHAVKNNRAKAASLETDKLQVEVTDKAGNAKLLVLDGDNAKAVKNSDHSVESVNKIINDIEGMQDYKVTPKSRVFDFSLRMPGKKVKNTATNVEERVWNPFEFKEQKANISEFYDPVKYARAYNSGQASAWAVGRMFNKNSQVDASGKRNLEQFTAKKQSQLDAYTDYLRAKAKTYGEGKTKNDALITSTESGLRRANKIGQEYNKQEQLNTDAIDKNNQLLSELKVITNARQKLNTLKSELAKMKEPKSGATAEAIKKKVKEVKKQTELVNEKQSQIDNLKRQTGSANASVAQDAVTKATDSNSKLSVQRNKLAALLNRLNAEKSNLSSNYKTNSPEFNKLTSLGEIEITFNGKKYKISPTKSTKKEDLLSDGLYKQGGSINKNKINKFLNYAKG